MVVTPELPTFSRAPTTTLEGWRSFVDGDPTDMTPLPDSDLEALTPARRELYDEQRISYHSELVIVQTSTVRGIIHQGRLLTMLNQRESQRPPRPGRLGTMGLRKNHGHQTTRKDPRAASPAPPPGAEPHPRRLHHDPAQGVPTKAGKRICQLPRHPPATPAQRHRHRRRRLPGPHRCPNRPGHRR